MTRPDTYFTMARHEETAGNLPAALNLYLSSLCAAYNSCVCYPTGTISKIRLLQNSLGIPDHELSAMVKSYGHLSDNKCRILLYLSISGSPQEIRNILEASYVR